MRKVRSQAGVDKYNLPIGSTIGTGTVPSFRVSQVVVHHANDPNDKSRAIVSHGGPVKKHVSIHSGMDETYNQHLDDVFDNNPHIAHLFHNIRGRMFRQSGDELHAQMDDGSYRHVGTLDWQNDGSVIARPTDKWAKEKGMGTRGKRFSNSREAMEHFVSEGGVPPEYGDGGMFRVTKKLREALNSKDNEHMRDAKPGETKTHDGQPIPPAWTQVEVSKNPKHPLQARGRDAQGNVQPLYSLDHKSGGLASKHARFFKVAQAMPKLDKKLSRREVMGNDTAAAVHLMKLTGMRVDSSTADKDESKPTQTVSGLTTYGATSLQARHVKVKYGKLHVDFVGKRGVLNHYVVDDKDMIDAVKKRKANKRPNDPLFDTTATKTGEYIKGALGVETDRPNHDLRTHVASSMAASLVNEMVDKGDLPTNAAQLKKARTAIAKRVGQAINDTPTVALSTYIAPQVLEPLEAKVK